MQHHIVERIALPNGTSQWITSPAAREDGHAWRARADAVLTGIGTVLQDDPLLNARLPGATRQPMLAIVDSQLQTPPGARLWSAGPRGVVICTAVQDPARWQALQALGAQIVACPNAHSKVDLAAMLKDLAQREVNEVHVEAGYKLNGSLMREGLVDEWLIYQAPKLLGDGPGVAALGPFTQIDQVPELSWRDVQRIGPDLRLRAVAAGRDEF